MESNMSEPPHFSIRISDSLMRSEFPLEDAKKIMDRFRQLDQDMNPFMRRTDPQPIYWLVDENGKKLDGY